MQDASTRHAPALVVEHGAIVARCGGGGTLAVLEMEVDGAPITIDALARQFGSSALRLGV